MIGYGPLIKSARLSRPIAGAVSDTTHTNYLVKTKQGRNFNANQGIIVSFLLFTLYFEILKTHYII